MRIFAERNLDPDESRREAGTKKKPGLGSKIYPDVKPGLRSKMDGGKLGD